MIVLRPHTHHRNGHKTRSPQRRDSLRLQLVRKMATPRRQLSNRPRTRRPRATKCSPIIWKTFSEPDWLAMSGRPYRVLHPRRIVKEFITFKLAEKMRLRSTIAVKTRSSALLTLMADDLLGCKPCPLTTPENSSRLTGEKENLRSLS